MAEEKKAEPRVEITQIATQTGEAYKLPDGTIVSFAEYNVWMGNQILDIRKAVG